MYYSEFFRETELIECVYTWTETYFKELVYVIVEAWRVQNLMREPGTWRLRKQLKFEFKGVRLVNQEEPVLQVKFEGRISSSSGEVLFRPSA